MVFLKSWIYTNSMTLVIIPITVLPLFLRYCRVFLCTTYVMVAPYHWGRVEVRAVPSGSQHYDSEERYKSLHCMPFPARHNASPILYSNLDKGPVMLWWARADSLQRNKPKNWGVMDGKKSYPLAMLQVPSPSRKSPCLTFSDCPLGQWIDCAWETGKQML